MIGTFTIDFDKEYTDVSITTSNMLGQTITSSTYASAKIITQEITNPFRFIFCESYFKRRHYKYFKSH